MHCRTDSFRQNFPVYRPCQRAGRRGGFLRFHAGLQAHEYRHRQTHCRGSAGHSPSHAGCGRTNRGILRQPLLRNGDPIVDDILARGKTAIIAGGTGLYMDALIRGNSFAPYPSTGMRERLEAQADAEGMEAMLDILRSIDPDAAARLHTADRKRILRALEVYYETGETITAHNRKTQEIPPKYRPIWFGLEDADRAELYARIDSRVDRMLEDGLLKEIKGLLAMGIPEKCTAMQAIGYKEFIDALNGHCDLEIAVRQVKQSSRHYAKRQLTWFRRNSAIHWLRREKGEKNPEILVRARQILAEFDK
ncbi:MAG: tRNA (adenosine(37)-N6)-dimethylallyltransferase MiaA [Oscillospiraceae bacterium]|nr:tRNA (adenosine(37)-N6)-dimethylallyltransferase MiaA [Oscillospiraceae bacterium]